MVDTRSKNSTARARQPVVSKASSSRTSADPVFARFYEGVIVESLDIGFDERTLTGDDAEQGAQRVARFGVALVVEGGEQGKQGFGVKLHDVRSVRVTAAGSISSRSAGCRLLPCQRALRAGMLPSGPFEVRTVRPALT